MNIGKINDMTYGEFERFAGKLIESQGYDVEYIPQGDDIGIDIIASNEHEKISVQVKKYIKRKINLDIVYHTFGASEFHDCSRCIIVTLSDLTKNAKQVAEKLNVEIWDRDKILEISKNYNIENENTDVRIINSESDWFDIIWNMKIKELEGKRIQLLSGKGYNTILKVDADGINIKSKNSIKRLIHIEIFKQILVELKEKGKLTRKYVDSKYKHRASSAICAIIANLEEVDVDNNSRLITLVWNK